MNKYIEELVIRFLGWKLPADFSPDGGIKFNPNANSDSPLELQYEHEPCGTNLFNDQQATDMLTHVTKPLIHRVTELEERLIMAQSAIQEAYSFQSSGCVPTIHDYGRWRRINESIEAVFKHRSESR